MTASAPAAVEVELLAGAGVAASVTLRPARPSDASFVMHSWLKSYADSPLADLVTREVYWTGQHELVEALLEREGTRVLVACATDDGDAILGWACVEGSVVHYAYVKHAYRGLGIARSLLGPLVGKACTYSHRTRALEAQLLPAEWEFDPYAAFAARHERGSR